MLKRGSAVEDVDGAVGEAFDGGGVLDGGEGFEFGLLFVVVGEGVPEFASVEVIGRADGVAALLGEVAGAVLGLGEDAETAGGVAVGGGGHG